MPRPLAALGVLLSPVIVMIAGSAAVTSITVEYETSRVLREDYMVAQHEAGEVRQQALRAREWFLRSTQDARSDLEFARKLQTAPSGVLDTTAVAALAPLMERLTNVLPLSVPLVPARPVEVSDSGTSTLIAASAELDLWTPNIRRDWSQHALTLIHIDELRQRLRTGIMAVTGAVPSTGASLLDSSGSASPDSRSALAAAMVPFERHTDEGTYSFHDLATYVDAAQSVQESHAAALAAAAAASGGGGGASGSPPGPFAVFPKIDPNNPPIVIFDGAYVGESCRYDTVNIYSGNSRGGEYIYIYYPESYEGRVLLFEDLFWVIIANACI